MRDRQGLLADVKPRLGHEATARLLLDKGADVAAAENDGYTALIWASLKGHEGGDAEASSPVRHMLEVSRIPRCIREVE